MKALTDLILPEAVIARLSVASKRHALLAMAESLGAATGLESRDIYEAVLMRERLAGTGVGEGAAIPHARIAGLKAPAAGFARLDPPTDFDALDGRPADLVVMLLAPADRGGDHLKALARVSRFLRRAEARERLRAARNVEEIMAAFGASLESDAA